MKRKRSSSAAFLAGLASLVVCAAAHSESRSYAIEWFSLASYSQDGDCPSGLNPPTRDQYVTSLELLGKTPEEARQLMDVFPRPGLDGEAVRQALRMRGRIDGKPVNGYIYPWAVADPKLNSVEGKFALGFDLDGKAQPTSFEDPMTHQKGVDNQLFRALGCIQQFRGTYEYRPTFWDFIWGSMKVTTPAWLFTVSGESLDRDGAVTITFDRALEHLSFGPAGTATADMTYRIDPDPRSHHEFQGQIRNGVLTVADPGKLVLLLDTLAFTELHLEQFHLRLNPKPNGHLEGLIGGYQPLKDVYFGIALSGMAGEGMIINDTPGIYYLLKRNADGAIDPASGEHGAISAAYHIEAVPVFAIAPKGTSDPRTAAARTP